MVAISGEIEKEEKSGILYIYIYKHIPTNDTFFDENNNKKKGIRYIY